MKCPSDAAFREALEGGEFPVELATHVEECSRCAARLEGLDDDPQLLDALRDLPPEPLAQDHPDWPAPPGYLVQGLLSRGGQAAVYEATHLATGREVAIKVLSPSSFSDPRAVRRFEREFEVVREFDHPSIVKVLDAGRVEGRRYIVMERIRGRHLDDWMADSRLGLDERLLLFLELLDAVQHAHQHGVLHRDLKPSNILVDEDGLVHLLDFGTAKPLTELAKELTRTGEFAGTLPWAAPEQIEGDPGREDARTDVHALGLLLYLVLTGVNPQARGENLAGLVETITRGTAPPPSSRDPHVDRDLDAIVAKALEKRPEHRYPSVDALARDIEARLSGRPVEAREGGFVYQFGTLVRRYRVPFAALLSIQLVVLAALFVSHHFWSRAKEEARTAREAERRANEELAARLRISDIVEARALLNEADTLWPVAPDLPERVGPWRERVEDLLSRQEEHRARLERLRAADVASGRADRAWFAEQLEDLDRVLSRLREEKARVAARAERARTLVETTVERYREIWNTCIESVGRDPRFEGLELSPVPGLVPLWRSPQEGVGLWEFWHVESGRRPRFDTRGNRWIPDPESGLVLVLVPAPAADGGPFLVSRYEMTIAQWERAAPAGRGEGPRFHVASWQEVTPIHPATGMTAREARVRLARLGLELPPETLWEHAARAGTESLWYCGDTVSSLEGHANVYDEGQHRGAGRNQAFPPTPGLDDGHSWHARVGSYDHNPFGLHDVVGNVGEWCAPEKALEGDELLREVWRGGSFAHPARQAAHHVRVATLPETTSPFVGVRPMLRPW